MASVNVLMPTCQPVSSAELQTYMNQALQKLLRTRETRSRVAAWRRQVETGLKSNSAWCAHILAWAKACTTMNVDAIAADAVAVDEVLLCFIEVYHFLHYQENASALERLAQLQRVILLCQTGVLGPTVHQRNYVQELELNYEDHDLEGWAFSEHLSQRPLDVTATWAIAPAPELSVDFETFDALPVRARNAKKWNTLFGQNPQLWSVKSMSWAATLKDAFFSMETKSESTSQDTYNTVVRVLREMRQVDQTIFSLSQWRTTIQASHLPIIVNQIGHPAIIVKQASHVQNLFRYNRISDALGLVLNTWTPEHLKAIPVMHQPNLPASVTQTSQITTGRQLIQALRQNPFLMPTTACPQSIYFLLRLENFENAWHSWLGPGLNHYGYQTLGTNVSSLHCQTINYLKECSQGKTLHSFGFPLTTIAERTLEFSETKKKVIAHAYQHKARNQMSVLGKDIDKIPKGKCAHCWHLSESQQCVQKIPVTVHKVDEELYGCGVSLADKNSQMQPIPLPQSRAGTKKIPPIYHPSELGLKHYQPNLEIIQRCKRFVYLLVNQENHEETLDFWLFNAFSDEILQRQLDHHQNLEGIKPLRRGQQFDFYTSGKMIPAGTRAATGGSPGDSYTMYRGMDGSTDKGINALFNHAEDAMILMETARAVSPELVKTLQRETEEADRLGITGATLYHCDNFGSPIHNDKDNSHGLCAQHLLQALPQEYSFCYMAYKIFIESQSNCLWSFDGRDAHATLLPSTTPLTNNDIPPGHKPYRLRGGGGRQVPIRTSLGSHSTVTQKDIRMARRYRQVRETRDARSQYWDGNVA